MKIACIGDSITWGYLVLRRRKNCYPAVLGKLMGKGFRVRNFGRSNATVRNESDMPYRKRTPFLFSLWYNPDVVTIMLGTNDTKRLFWNKDVFYKDYVKLVDAYQRLKSKPRIFICTPVIIHDNWGLHSETLENEVIPILRRIAQEKGLTIIDTHSVLNDKSLYVDGVHPNRTGARMIAEFIAGELKKELI